MNDKFFLDTNILVYAYDTHLPKKQRIAQNLLREAIETGRGVLSAQVLSEFYVVVTQRLRKPFKPEEAQEIIKLVSILPLIDTSLGLVYHSIDLSRRHRISFWDAMIIAAAAEAECGVVQSEDLNDGQRYDHLIIQNPFRGD